MTGRLPPRPLIALLAGLALVTVAGCATYLDPNVPSAADYFPPNQVQDPGFSENPNNAVSNAAEQAPIIHGVTVPASTPPGQAVTLSLNASDLLADDVYFFWQMLTFPGSSPGVFSATSLPSVTWNPPPGVFGTFNLQVKVVNPVGEAAIANISLNVTPSGTQFVSASYQ